MLNKIYSKIIKFIKKYIFIFLILIIIYTILNIKIPYYIESPGSIINLKDRIEVLNGYDSKGSFNLSYVSMYDGTIGTYLISLINKEWDIYPLSDRISNNESINDVNTRNKLMLENSFSNAYAAVLNYLKKDLNILSSNFYVVYIDELSSTNLEIGDKIIEIDNIKINSIDDIKEYLKTKSKGDKLKVIVNDNKEKYIYVDEVNGNKTLYLSVICNYDYTDYVNFNFKEGESGSSGGLMIALSIYDQLTKQDLTNGLKIAGTGTIDINGNVGEISGIKYKIIGAVKEGIDIFFVPYKNYKDAKEIIDKYNYNIELVSIKTFKDAINYLS